MNPLQARLASLRRRLRVLVLGRGTSMVLALLVGCALAACLVDWYVRLPSPIRAFLLVSILGTAGAVAYVHLIAPLRAKVDDLTLALRIEEEYPQLNDALASTVQFLQQPPDAATAGSPSLRKEAVQRALRQAEACDFEKIVDRRGVRIAGVSVLVILVLAGFFYFSYPSLAQTALLRLAEPFGNHTWTTVTLTTPEPTSRRTLIAEKQPFLVRARIEGIIPANARVELEGTAMPDKIVAVKNGLVEVAPVDMTQQRTKFRFRLWANDGVYPSARSWHEVDVLPPPKLVALNGLPSPQIELHYPAYTDLPSPHHLSPGTRHVEAVAGASMILRAATDRELDQAWIEYVPDKQPVKPAAMASFLGQLHPWTNFGALVGGCQVWGRFPAQFLSEHKTFAIAFQPWVSGSYLLHLRDSRGLEQSFESDLRVIVDPPPVVTLHRPASSQSVLADADVNLKIQAEDEMFAVRSVYLEYRRKNAEGQWSEPEPRRLLLHDSRTAGRLGSPLLTALGVCAGQGQHVWPALSTWRATEVASVGPVLRLRPKHIETGRRWSLKGLVKEGDILVIQACADDFNDVYLDNPAGRSHEVELRIVGKQELARILDEGLAQVQQELVRAQQMQEDAQKLVKEVQEQKNKGLKEVDPKAQADKLQKQLDKIVEAEQLQKQLQERLGNKEDQGLRADVAKLKQMLRDNQMPPSAMEDRLRKLASELERLAQEELQQIEPNLAEARKDLARETKPTPKSDPKKDKQSPLDEAQKHQAEAKKTLDELVKFLDPWANMHLVKGKARDILQKQNELKRETQKIEEDIRNLFKEKRDQWKADLEKNADAQQNLKERMQDLLNTMKEMENKRREQQKKPDDKKTDELVKKPKGKDEEGNKPEDQRIADVLKEAQKQAADAPEKMANANQQMKKAADNMLKSKEPPPLNKVAADQQDAAKQVEKALAALEERREDKELDLLRKKNKDFQKNLDDIADKQDLLQKKVKQARDNPDPEKREQELKKLAQEQQKLKDEVEKQRELARLEADRAAKDLGQAAQEMDRAAKQLANGEDPQEAMEQALERIEQAQLKLEEEEEELAREQLAKIADQIKGLKERQDAAIAEMERIHKSAVQTNKQWSRGLQSSLGDLAKTQKGLGQETESLKEKLKDALVFAHVLEKTAKVMERAGKAMDDRREEIPPRPLDEDEIKGQNKAQETTLNLQQDASRRLGRLLDALKQELAKREKKEPMEGGEQPEEQKGGLRAQDGIPAVAQLKALREEQMDVNERTKAFAERHPDAARLNDDQRAELREIHQDQERLRTLFEQMTTPKDQKGGNP